MAHGSSQARDRVRVIDAKLPHSHSHPHPLGYINLRLLPEWVNPGPANAEVNCLSVKVLGTSSATHGVRRGSEEEETPG